MQVALGRCLLLACVALAAYAGEAALAEAPPAWAPAAYAQVAKTRDGIGKAYLGREIAHYMSHEGAPWLERPEREREEEPSRMLRALALRPDMVVADFGCGSGYLTAKIAPLVARVLAVDIQQEMVDLVAAKARELKLTNVEPLRCTETDPKLPAGALDLVLLVDVYHEISEPIEVVRGIRAALKPGGRLVLVEYRGEDPAVPIKPLHKMTEAQARREMASFGMRWVETIGILPRQHILVFAR